MGQRRGIGDTLRLPGRRLRQAVTVLVVVVMAGAAGGAVALTAPTLVSDLGIVAPPPVAVPPVPQPVLGPLRPDAPRPTAAGVAAVLDGAADAMPGRSFTGVVLDPADGAQLWARDPDQALVPGSTGKILTAAAALLTLDPSRGFTTRVLAGPEPGTVVLVGGGDPTLTVLPEGEEGLYPEAPRLSQLADEVRGSPFGPVTRVLVDTTHYTGPTLAPGWDPEDVPGGFVAPIEPLMLDGGRIDPKEQDGPRVEDPALTAGRALAGLLGADPGAVAEGTAPDGAAALAAVRSAPFVDLVEHLLRSSDNVLAEALAREAAIVRNAEPSFSGAAEQTLAALSQAGFDPSGAVLSDASGLSVDDRVPASLLGQLLAVAAAPAKQAGDTEFLRPILTGLPVAGGDGTLDDRFARETDAAEGRGVVRAKTGTLTGVSSLAGVVTDVDGRLLVFAFMSNGASPATVRPELDAMASALSGCGCR